ncbi:MAG: mechanosensitive ion channel family protein [Hyphomicrobiales bacterium]
MSERSILRIVQQAFVLAVMLACLTLFPVSSLAQTDEQPQEASEASEANAEPADAPKIALPDKSLSEEEFALRLVHFTRAELAEAAKQWINVTQQQTKHAADINIALFTAEGPTAERLRADLAKALDERNRLFDKLDLILNEWEAKGGKPDDIAEYRKYKEAVVRSELKATDPKTVAKWGLQWLTSSEGGGRIGLRLLSLVAMIFLAFFLARIFTALIGRSLRRVPQMSNLLRDFISKMAYWLLVGVGVVIALTIFGIDMTPILAVFGGASFILGFAMQSTLSNLASGLLLMVTKPFDVGDMVDAAGVSGTVKNVSIVSTTIVTLDNKVIVVPNTQVWDSVITNVNASDIRRVDLTFGIAYDDDIELARRSMMEVLNANPRVLKEPAPVIGVSELADSSVNLICFPWVKTEDYWEVLWELQQKVKERFDEVGLSIPFPQRDVHVHRAVEDLSGEAKS